MDVMLYRFRWFLPLLFLAPLGSWSFAHAEENTATEPATGASEDEFDIRVPRFDQLQTKWGVELTGTPSAFSQTRTQPGAFSGTKLRSFQLAFEYLPLTTEQFGILGVGPSLAFYTASPAAKSVISLWSGGAELRYQARYFRGQPIVPTAAYELEYWHYSGVQGASGHIIAKGPAVGAMILLNFLDHSDAANFYAEYGVCRSYLVAEMRMLSGNDTQVNLKGTSYFFGLRFEL